MKNEKKKQKKKKNKKKKETLKNNRISDKPQGRISGVRGGGGVPIARYIILACMVVEKSLT